MLNEKIIGFEVFAEEFADQFGDVSAYESFLKQFVALLKHGARIIDVACGPGNVTAFVYQCRKDLHIECVDIAPAMIKIVKERFPEISCHVGDIRNFELKPNHYDGVICSFGLPFLDEKATGRFFNNMSGALKKNGVVYLSTMQGNSEGYEKTSFSGDSEIYFIYHSKTFLDSVIRAHGLKIIAYQEQLFLQENAEDLIDMIYILRKVK